MEFAIFVGIHWIVIKNNYEINFNLIKPRAKEIKHEIKHVKNWFGYQRKRAHKVQQQTEKEKESSASVNSEPNQKKSQNSCSSEDIKQTTMGNFMAPQARLVPMNSTTSFFQNPGMQLAYLMVPVNSFKNGFGMNPMFNYLNF